MAVSLSAAVLLGVLVWLLWRYAGVQIWHIVICALFGFYLSSSTVRPDGSPIDPRDDWEEWKDILAEASVRDVRVHDGRHTSATLLIEYGVDVRVVMAVLGHSDLRVTMRYAHASNPLLRDAAARMGQGLWGAMPSPPTATSAATDQRQRRPLNQRTPWS